MQRTRREVKPVTKSQRPEAGDCGEPRLQSHSTKNSAPLEKSFTERLAKGPIGLLPVLSFNCREGSEGPGQDGLQASLFWKLMSISLSRFQPTQSRTSEPMQACPLFNASYEARPVILNQGRLCLQETFHNVHRHWSQVGRGCCWHPIGRGQRCYQASLAISGNIWQYQAYCQRCLIPPNSSLPHSSNKEFSSPKCQQRRG